MKEELEQAKLSLQNINDLIDVKENPVVSAVLLAPIKAIPVIGELVDSSTDKLLEDFQHKKEQELIDVILRDNCSITSKMVNDVEFIINYARVVDAVRRLATNDKVHFFGNLIRNGYLSGDRIDNNEFEENLNILNSMSYREIQLLVDYKVYCEEKSQKITPRGKIIEGKTIRYNMWNEFRSDYVKYHPITGKELYSAFVKIKQTGFLEEEFETDSGDVDEDDNTFDSLSIDSIGFYITQRFLRFHEMVLKME